MTSKCCGYVGDIVSGSTAKRRVYILTCGQRTSKEVEAGDFFDVVVMNCLFFAIDLFHGRPSNEEVEVLLNRSKRYVGFSFYLRCVCRASHSRVSHGVRQSGPVRRRSGGPFVGFSGGPDRSGPAVRRTGPVRAGFEAVA